MRTSTYYGASKWIPSIYGRRGIALALPSLYTFKMAVSSPVYGTGSYPACSLPLRLPTLLPPPLLEALPPLTVEAQVCYAELLKLRATVEATDSPMHNIGLSVPFWLTDAQAMHVFSGADRANLSIRDIGHPRLAIAAFHNLDLCRVPSEYLPCQADRVMTLDLSNTELTAAVLYLTPTSYLGQHRTDSVNHNVGSYLTRCRRRRLGGTDSLDQRDIQAHQKRSCQHAGTDRFNSLVLFL